MRQKTPHNQGFDAGYKGEPLTKNPFLVVAAGKDAVAWVNGWYEGRDAAKSDLAEKRKESAR